MYLDMFMQLQSWLNTLQEQQRIIASISIYGGSLILCIVLIRLDNYIDKKKGEKVKWKKRKL